ncbi:hypothetical protein [Propionivibrio sp.]|uniref:hypothetical protein n=1 Tax=Propionivibrio sp. TaxID=2212460 RepID=UPI003BF35789
MHEFDFYPLAGINTVAPDTDMVKTDNNSRRVYARDLLNGRVDSAGRWAARQGTTRVSTTNLTCLWHSERFNESFAIHGTDLVRVADDWSFEVIGTGVGGEASYCELNNTLVIATPRGLYEWNGANLLTLTLADPPAPYAQSATVGGLDAGTYAVAISYRRDYKESSVSEAVFVEVAQGGGIDLTLPSAALLEPSATHISIYLSHPNGGDLYEVQMVLSGQTSLTLGGDVTYGKLAAHRFLTAMPTGKTVRFWRGRLVTPVSNTLHFSEALNYHLNDPRHGFIQLPTRITFVEPVDGGLWVGQKTHAIFLSGDSLETLTIAYKNSRAPIPWSSTRVNSELFGDGISEGGATTACWMAANGYVIGTSSGVAREVSAGVLDGITGTRGQTIAHNRFFLTITS